MCENVFEFFEKGNLLIHLCVHLFLAIVVVVQSNQLELLNPIECVENLLCVQKDFFHAF